MKTFTILFSLLMASATYALTLPQIPKNCFADEDKNYCSRDSVVKSEEAGQRVMRVNFFAKLDGDIYDEELILDKFLDFESWGDYTSRLSEYGSFKKAFRAGHTVVIDHSDTVGVIDYNGTTAIVNEAVYWMDLPFPFTQIKVVEQALYFEVEAAEGALFTWKFISDPSFTAVEGLIYKSGVLSVASYYDVVEDRDMYYAYITVDVIPDFGSDVGIVLTIGADYVARGMVAIFSGMFDDE